MEDLKQIIAHNLSGLRRSASMTQIDLAERLHYSDKAVSKWERGESIPDVTVLKQIADYFDVSVDYLLTESHDEYNKQREKRRKVMSRNKSIITLLAECLVWLLATYIFLQVLVLSGGRFPAWLMFIYALPVSSIVLLVLNSVWGNRRFNYVIISILIWVLLLSIHLSFLSLMSYNIGLIYVLGVPAQIIILLWSGLRRVH